MRSNRIDYRTSYSTSSPCTCRKAIANKARINEDHVRSIQGIHEAIILALELDPSKPDADATYGAPEYGGNRLKRFWRWMSQLVTRQSMPKDPYFQGGHLTDYGLKAFSQAYDAAVAQLSAENKDKLDLVAFHNIYFELVTGQSSGRRPTRARAKPTRSRWRAPARSTGIRHCGRQLIREPFIGLKRGGLDILLVDIHPNDATKKEIVSNDVGLLLRRIFTAKAAEGDFRLTVMVDITLNHPGEARGESPARGRRSRTSRSGKLQSGPAPEPHQVHLKLGMDKHSGGLVLSW